jgi:uncharacterized protein (DUF1697 family)
MKTYISLLRGINVSGQKKIKMTELAILYENIGFQSVQTYIQSGNVVFTSDKTLKIIRNIIQQSITEKFGFEVPVLVLSSQELDTIVKGNPYLSPEERDIKPYHVTLLSDLPDEKKISSVKEYQDSPNEFSISGKIIYLKCPQGYGRIKINNTFFEKKLGVGATTRNWKTILTLAEMAKNK